MTPAHDVACAGYVDVLKCLLRYGADVDVRDSWGNTPAHMAAKYGHADVVRYLSHATDLLKAVNMHGQTPLDYGNESPGKNDGQCVWIQEMKGMSIDRQNEAEVSELITKRYQDRS